MHCVYSEVISGARRWRDHGHNGEGHQLIMFPKTSIGEKYIRIDNFLSQRYTPAYTRLLTT
jgi:hypothetical protein